MGGYAIRLPVQCAPCFSGVGRTYPRLLACLGRQQQRQQQWQWQWQCGDGSCFLAVVSAVLLPGWLCQGMISSVRGLICVFASSCLREAKSESGSYNLSACLIACTFVSCQVWSPNSVTGLLECSYVHPEAVSAAGLVPSTATSAGIGAASQHTGSLDVRIVSTEGRFVSIAIGLIG